MGVVRVVVVEDSLTVRKHLIEVLSSDPGVEVVGEAGDGKRAIELCEALRPDVLTLDMMLPVMSGVAVTEYLMAHRPLPILVVSASTNRGELFKTYDALAAGAIEVLEKPGGERHGEAWEREFISLVKLVARIPVVSRVRRRPREPGVTASPRGRSGGGKRLVALGASTGGPGAVLAILRQLPRDLPVPVLIVIHIGEPFGTALPEWLGDQTQRPVRYAVHGEALPPRGSGTVLLAPPGRHLVVSGAELSLSRGPERNFCRPSVDVLYESLAREVGAGVLACLLTGMGKDGAAGLQAIRRAGGETIAQDEATSVIFGMPKEAIHLEAAERVLPLDQIAPRIVQAAGGGRVVK